MAKVCNRQLNWKKNITKKEVELLLSTCMIFTCNIGMTCGAAYSSEYAEYPTVLKAYSNDAL